MKARMLKKLGWRVIKIPLFEWKEVNRGESWKPKKVEYLKRKLSDVLMVFLSYLILSTPAPKSDTYC